VQVENPASPGSKSGRPTVSFCIPVFNGSQTIKRCVNSVLADRVEGAELVVVDNGSTDATVAMAEAALRGHENARLVQNGDNLGRVENWNRCLAVSRGDYVRFVMVGDVLWPGSTRLLLEAARQHPTAVMITSNLCPWNGTDWPPPSVDWSEPPNALEPRETLRAVASGVNPFRTLTAMLIKRDAVSASGCVFRPDLPYLADIDFCSHLAMAGPTVALTARTYWFNVGDRSRFHFAGRDLSAILRESSVVYSEIARLLATLGDHAWSRERSMWLKLRVGMQRGMTPSPRQIAQAFSGHVRYQVGGISLWCYHRSGLAGWWAASKRLLGRWLPLRAVGRRLSSGRIPEEWSRF
jgi:glycosyltransferase involved in cell wall biosynthesis